MSTLLRTQNDQLLLRLRTSEETSSLIQRAIETLISGAGKKQPEPSNQGTDVSVETMAEKLKMNEEMSNNSSMSASPAMANVQMQGNN
jgi:hypothetical protein